MENIRNRYIELKIKYEKLLIEEKRRLLVISLLRLVVFIAGAAVSVFAFSYSALPGFLAVLVTLILFLLLVKKYLACTDHISFTENLIKINTNEIRALDGDYSAFDCGSDFKNPGHDFSEDIDLFGEESLFRYLNRTVTGPGRKFLADWISDPLNLKDQIAERQEAVAELSGMLEWRQRFMAYGPDKPLDINDIENLNSWLADKDDFFGSPFFKISTIILPVAVVIVLFLTIAGLVPLDISGSLFILNLFLIGMFIRRSNRIHAVVSRKHQFLTSARRLIRTFETGEFKSPLLTSVQGKLCSEKGSAAEKINELDKIIRSFDSRLNIFAGLLLNGLFLWDFRCILRLEKWRRSVRGDLPAWLSLIGEIDGLNSLANYTYNNPGYIFPGIVTDGNVLAATKLGHPLLANGTRVHNDFLIERKGMVFIITGANMAGKSTFLRTVAINFVLAMTGAPVCAEKMKLSPVRLFTSMRTTDSLSHNESYFYAELKRLKTLKERLEKGEEIFFILDEILKGTNSTDKSLGSKLFLRKLIGLKATGLIATHDISLGEMENEFPENIVNRCFETEINGENITFDYRLREGITRKMNAAILMKQMGIAGD